jgi:hypothetical protein
MGKNCLMQTTQPALPVTMVPGAGESPLAGLADSLEQIVKSSEEDFLALGMNLQQLRSLSSAQRQKIAATMSLFQSAEEGGILPLITAHVRERQQQTEAAQQTAAELCVDLAAMLKLLDSIALKTRALERAGLFLHVIGINTGIECARHGRMEAMFKVVSHDTVSLAEQIRQTTGTLLDRTSKARAEQEKTLAGARKNIESLQVLARESQQATGIALAKVAELIDYSMAMVKEVERLSVNITAEINRVVMGIQFHDNLRQRIEHISQALLEIAALPEEAPEETVCATYLAVVLQQAQLANLIGELDQLYLAQTRALANILEAISHLETRLESVASERTNPSPQGNPVAALLAGISTLGQLSSASLALGQEIRSSSEGAEQTARAMHMAVEGTFAIANNVKINALNAIIKAAKFGRVGESLQVLAQGMVSVAQDTRQLVGVFNALITQLGALVDKPDPASSGPTEIAVSEEFDSARVEQVFHRFRDELQASKNDCQRLSRSLEGEQRQLVFIARLKEALQVRADQLAAYGESIRPHNEELLETLRGRFGQQLEARYTMREERQIHQQLQLVEKSPAVAPQEITGGAGDGLFFDEPSPVAVPGSVETATNQNKDFGDNIELF